MDEEVLSEMQETVDTLPVPKQEEVAKKEGKCPLERSKRVPRSIGNKNEIIFQDRR